MSTEPPVSEAESAAAAGAAPMELPGAILRAARERAGLSQEAVGQQLHLRPSLVDAIERDDYRNLPEPTFVRGYMRAYAKVLGMDSTDLIQLYDAKGAAEAPRLGKIIPDKSEQLPTSGHPLMRWISLVICVVLAVLVFLWWQTNSESSLAVPASGDTVSIPETTLPADDGVGEELTPPVVLNDDLESAVVAESVAEVEQVAAEVPASVEQVVVVEPVVPPEPRVEVRPDSAVAAAVGDSALIITVRDSSWVEVTAADGQVLLYALVTAAESPMTVHGKPPFAVFLGDSPQVALQLDGVLLDQSRFNRANNTARFAVDQQGVRRR